MGLFDKKYCDICGEKIKFLGNNKLEDGNMCNACEKKLSVWFKNRRHSTVAEIKDMLADREENARLFQNFRATRELGHDKCIIIDDNMGRFIVMGDGESMSKNPELFELSKVQSARLEIKEDKSEVKRKDANGNMVSFNPPHYSYKYTFYVIINYSGKYINEMKVRLNGLSVNGGTDGEKYQGETWMDGIKSQLGFNSQPNRNIVQVDRFGKRQDLPGGYRTDGLTSMADIDIQHYQDYENEGNEIVAALMGRSSAAGTGINAVPVRGADVSPVNNVNVGVSQADLQKNLMDAMQSGDPLRVVEANNAILNAGMVPDNMQTVQNQRKILEMKSQAMNLENTDFYRAVSLYKQAIAMGDKDYDDILVAYLNWISKPGSSEADCQELIKLAEQAKASGFNSISADRFINIANTQINMKRQGIQPAAYSSANTGSFAQKPTWTCEYCGKSDNTGKFCLDCGAAKP